MLELCVLSSGSRGNAIYVGDGTTGILVDNGLSCKCLLSRLAEAGIDPAGISALCLTHEHVDHLRGVRVLKKKRPDLALYCNAETHDGMAMADRALDWTHFIDCRPFAVGTLTVTPFPVPHDAAATVGFAVESGGTKVAIATDLGEPTPTVEAYLAGSDAIVLESNHDEYMLAMCNRPWTTKQRIKGRSGHLSNDQAAELLSAVDTCRTREVFLAHVSDECNTPDEALETVGRALRKAGKRISLRLTDADRPTALYRFA